MKKINDDTSWVCQVVSSVGHTFTQQVSIEHPLCWAWVYMSDQGGICLQFEEHVTKVNSLGQQGDECHNGKAPYVGRAPKSNSSRW